MKTRYFVSDSYKLDDNVVGRELDFRDGSYYFKDGIVSGCAIFCGKNSDYVKDHVTKSRRNGIIRLYRRWSYQVRVKRD